VYRNNKQGRAIMVTAIAQARKNKFGHHFAMLPSAPPMQQAGQEGRAAAEPDHIFGIVIN
jgi:hypothetical protein